jgi:hypothetical protein
MVDTVRTLSAILALLADNTSGDISAQDARDMVVSIATPSIGDGFGIWSLGFTEDGSDMSDWTSRTGTWAVSSGKFLQSDTAESNAHLERTSGKPFALLGAVMQATINFPSSGAGGSTQKAGFNLSHLSGSGQRTNEVAFWLTRTSGGAGALEFDVFGAGGSSFSISTLALDTNYVLKMVRIGDVWSIYLDGTLQMTVMCPQTGRSNQADTVSLVTRTGKATFDDISLYTLTVP